MRALFLALALPCHAATVGVHLGSYHFPNSGMNNLNPGLYVRSDEGWVGGAYVNSLRRPTFYLGREWREGPFALQAGLVTGYSRPVLPAVVPSIYLDSKWRLSFVPKVEKGGASVLHLSRDL